MDESTLLPPPVIAARDRRGWLILFGIIEILLGALCALMAGLMMAFLLFADRLGGLQAPPPSRAPLVAAVVLYGLFALFFVSVGIGTMRRRRWARVVMLMASSLWLAFGALGLVMFAAIFPAAFESAMAGRGGAPSPALVPVLVVTFALLGFLYILLPAGFLFFYTRKSVKAAFRGEPPVPGQAAPCPVPVLALSVWMALSGVLCLFGLLVRVQVVFGTILTGLSAALVTMLLAGIRGWIARGLYRVRRGAWRGALALYVLTGISGVVTFTRRPAAEIYRKVGRELGLQTASASVLEATGKWAPYTALAGAAIMISFVLFVGRYIPRDRGPEAPTPAN